VDEKSLPAIALPRNEHQKLVSLSDQSLRSIETLSRAPDATTAGTETLLRERILVGLHRNAGQGAVDAVRRDLTNPPGKEPSADLKEESDWFRGLDEKNKAIALRLVSRGAEMALFGFFCVIDGVSFVDDGPAKGKFEVFFLKAGKRIKLNDEKEEYLHDIYCAIAKTTTTYR
jgi:hypothetical protein